MRENGEEGEKEGGLQGKGRERERRVGTRDGGREGGEREKDSLQTEQEGLKPSC